MLELEGPRVRLRPLQAGDAEALLAAAADGSLWQLTTTVVPSPDSVREWIDTALQGRAAGTMEPFVTVVKDGERVVGSTRMWKIDRLNRRLEIGATWLARAWQRSFVNTEAKYLMLRHAFEQLDCVRVQFTTDESNHASRDAILRLGARYEGLIRHERIMPGGRKRNSLRFSIIDDEWPAVRERLLQRLEGRGR